MSTVTVISSRFRFGVYGLALSLVATTGCAASESKRADLAPMADSRADGPRLADQRSPTQDSLPADGRTMDARAEDLQVVDGQAMDGQAVDGQADSADPPSGPVPPFGSSEGTTASNFELPGCDGALFGLHAQYRKHAAIVILYNDSNFT